MLSKSLEHQPSPEELLQHIERLLLDYRRNIIDQKLALLLQEIEKAADNPQKLEQLRTEYNTLNDIIKNISRGLGNRLR